MEGQMERIETPEIDQINQLMDKLVGGYSLMSKAFMAQQIAELKVRIDKAGCEFGKLRSKVTELEQRPDRKEIEVMVNAAKTELRGEK